MYKFVIHGRLVDCRAKKINEFIPYGIPGEVTALDLSQET